MDSAMDSTSSPQSTTTAACASTPPTTAAESTSTTSVTLEPVCPPASDRWAQYVQSRIERKHKEKEATRDVLMQAKKELSDSRDRELQLRQTLKVEEQTLLTRKKSLEEIDKKIQQAQAQYQVKRKGVVCVQKSINQLKEAIIKGEGSIRDSELKTRQMEKELENGLEDENTEVLRQALILDMSSSEIEAIANHALNNSAFGEKIARAAQHTATPVMIREIQSEMYSRMTGVTSDEFRDLMQRIQSTMDDLQSENMGDETDDSEDSSKEPENNSNKTGCPKDECRDIVELEESNTEDKPIRPGRRSRRLVDLLDEEPYRKRARPSAY